MRSRSPAAPEDILLQKLRWFRLGQEVSDLDHDYLRRGADVLGVTDLLGRAVQTVEARE
jgi:hypothetical protein